MFLVWGNIRFLMQLYDGTHHISEQMLSIMSPDLVCIKFLSPCIHVMCPFCMIISLYMHFDMYLYGCIIDEHLLAMHLFIYLYIFVHVYIIHVIIKVTSCRKTQIILQFFLFFLSIF